MKPGKQIIYAVGLSILFLSVHVLILQFKLPEAAVFASIVATMIVIQISAYRILKRSVYERLSFKRIFLCLALTQISSVLLLTLYSAAFPTSTTQPVKFLDVLISLVLFGLLLPVLVTFAITLVTRRSEKSLGQGSKL